MPPDHDDQDVQVRGWEPSNGAESTDVGLTLGELPAGFGVASYPGDEMTSYNMAALTRLAPPSTASGYAPSLLGGLHIDDHSYLPSSAASSQSGTSPGAFFESPPPAFHLPTPPQTRSPSLASGRARSGSGTGARAAVSSRSPAAAGVIRKTRTSTQRKFERKLAENANYIPRPKNSFILFRTEFVARHKKAGEAFGSTASAAAAATTAAMLAAERRVRDEGYNVGGDGDELERASLSKQASEVWHRMNEAEKQPWVDLAEKEKEQHARLHPDYRYRPQRANSTSTMPTDHLAASAHGRTGKSASPGGGCARTTRSRSIPTEGSVESAKAREKEEAQKRRCELIRDLMAQGYRGGELTHALLMLEGGVLPPCAPLSPLSEGGDFLPVPAPAPPVRQFQAASIPAAINTSNTAPSSISSSDSITAQPPTLAEASMPRPTAANTSAGMQAQAQMQMQMQMQRAPTLIMPSANAAVIPPPPPHLRPPQQAPILLGSSSSLACALTPLPKPPSPPALPRIPTIPSLPRALTLTSNSSAPSPYGPIPRSPSAPIFDTRPQGVADKKAVERVSASASASASLTVPPSSASCPPTPTPTPHAQAMDVDDNDDDDDDEKRGSSYSSSTPSTLPMHSFPPSPDAEMVAVESQPQAQSQSSSQIQPAGPAAGSGEYRTTYERASQNDYVPMNEFYERYDSNASPLPTYPSSTSTSVSSAAFAAQHDRNHQRPLEAVAAMWSHHAQSQSQSQSDFMHFTGQSSPWTVAALPDPISSPGMLATAAATAGAPPACNPPSTGLGLTASDREDIMRALSGLPMPPPMAPRDVTQLPFVMHPAPSLGRAASQRTDGDIEAYHLGLGNVLSSSSSSSSSLSSSTSSLSDDGASNCFEFFDLDFGSSTSSTTAPPSLPDTYSALGLDLDLYNSANPDEFNLDNFFHVPMNSSEGGVDQKEEDAPSDLVLGFGRTNNNNNNNNNTHFDDGYARFIQTS